MRERLYDIVVLNSYRHDNPQSKSSAHLRIYHPVINVIIITALVCYRLNTLLKSKLYICTQYLLHQ